MYFKNKGKSRDVRYEEQSTLKRRGIARILSIIPAVGAIVVFILTEDMTQPMQITDNWTWVMAAIALVQTGVAALTIKKRDDNTDGRVGIPVQ